ncbi:MAG: Ig-like domain-containing protein, partial [Candidatus Bipolaricaulis sp.]|nr:Ig-like domain-containing protein [Candidatus Bipolaricaulis sp.]
INVDEWVVINFSEFMKHSTIIGANIKLFNESDELITLDEIITADYSKDGVSQTQVVLIPESLLDYETEYYVTITKDVTDLADNPFAGWEEGDYSFTTGTEEVVELHPTAVYPIKTTGMANDEYNDGWAWRFEITVPGDENSLQMSFQQWIRAGGAASIDAGGNMRIYSAQSVNASDVDDAIEIEENGELSDALLLDGDIDANTAGRQIEVVVEMKIPVGSAGSYSTNYTLFSEVGPI